MQIYLRILFYLTIYLHHLPIMNDVHRQQEVGLSMKHSPASEPPEGYPDISNAELKAMLDAHITSFIQLPEMVRAELIDSTCADAVDVDTWAISMSPEYYRWHFCNVHTTLTQCSYLAVRPHDSAEYEKWTALAMLGHLIFIHPSY